MPLTAEESKQLTYLNLLSFDIARKKASQTNTRIPAFLCSSEDAKAGYRKEALQILNDNANPIIPFDDGPNIDTVENFIRKTLGSNGKRMYDLWVQMETELKDERDKNNPGAFFV